MTFKSVFRSLQEVFPGIDIRILKAVAIEHSKDADAAVEFILSDVLPIISTAEPSFAPDISYRTENSIAGGQTIISEAISGPSNVGPNSAEALEEGSHEGMGKINSWLSDREVVEQNENLLLVGQTIASEAISGPSSVGPKSLVEASEQGSHENVSKINFWLSDREVVEQNENLLPSENEIVSDEKFDATFHQSLDAYFSTSEKGSHEDVSKINFWLSDREVAEQNENLLPSGNEIVSDEKFDATFHQSLDAYFSNLLSSNQVSDPEQLKAVTSTEFFQISRFVTDGRESRDDNAGECSNSRSEWTLAEEDSNYTSALLSLANSINVNHVKLGAKMDNGVKDYANILDVQLSGSLKNESTIQNPCNLEVNYNPISVLNSFHKIVCASGYNSDSVKPQAEESTHTKASSLSLEKKGPNYMVQDDSKLLEFENETASTDDGTHITTIALQPGQITEIDVLNSYTDEAINTKEKLVSARNSAAELLKEVEIHEERAKQAKEAASSAGRDILTLVEDLCQMVNTTKEKNEKSAGEIYGEKSILAAETRELQSRLVSISDDRDKYLSIIDEIHRTLEARLSAAEKERVEAEQEKLDKEDSAQKAFEEQEAIMDSILEESERLQQEVKENAKLRDFLVDRGHIIDTLQGEIAAACEDVMSLKRRVEDSVQIKKPESSGTMSLESQLSPVYDPRATSSAKVSLSEGADHAPVIENTKQANIILQQLNPESSTNEPKSSCSDDEWEIFNL